MPLLLGWWWWLGVVWWWVVVVVVVVVLWLQSVRVGGSSAEQSVRKLPVAAVCVFFTFNP